MTRIGQPVATLFGHPISLKLTVDGEEIDATAAVIVTPISFKLTEQGAWIDLAHVSSLLAARRGWAPAMTNEERIRAVMKELGAEAANELHPALRAAQLRSLRARAERICLALSGGPAA
jgi:hypothetical protein